MPDTHDDLVAVLRAHGNGGERPSRPASAQAADRLEELAAEVEALRASDDLTDVVALLAVQLGCDRSAKCPVCHHWVANGHAEDCAWTALVFLVEGPRHG